MNTVQTKVLCGFHYQFLCVGVIFGFFRYLFVCLFVCLFIFSLVLPVDFRAQVPICTMQEKLGKRL